jgi:acyl-ACP thioesterase
MYTLRSTRKFDIDLYPSNISSYFTWISNWIVLIFCEKDHYIKMSVLYKNKVISNISYYLPNSK